MLTIWGGGDTQALVDGKKIELKTLTGNGDANNFAIFPSP